MTLRGKMDKVVKSFPTTLARFENSDGSTSFKKYLLSLSPVHLNLDLESLHLIKHL